MGFLVSPGVEINESDLTNVIPAVSTSIGGFAGHFTWGPVDELITVGSEKDLATAFGRPTLENSASFLTSASFLKYANALRVARAVPANSANAVAGANGSINGLLVKNASIFEGISPATLTTSRYFVARCPGALGNTLKVVVAYGTNSYTGDISSLFDAAPGTSTAAAAKGVSNDEIHVVIYDEDGEFSGVKGTVLEKYEGLSLASDAKKEDGSSLFYKDVINQNSSYIFVNSIARVFENADLSLASALVQADGFSYIGSTSQAASVILPTTVTVVNQNEIGGSPVGSPTSTVENYEFTIKSVLSPVALGNNTTITFVKTVSTPTISVSAIAPDAANGLLNVVVNLKTNASNNSISTVAEINAALLSATGSPASGPGSFALSAYVIGVNDTRQEVQLSVFNPTSVISTYPLSGGGELASTTLNFSLIKGSDGTADASEVVTALELFADAESVDVNFLFAENFIQGSVNYTVSDQKTIDDVLIQIANNRKDVLAFISAPLDIAGLTSDAQRKSYALTKFNTIGSSSYCVFDSSPVYVYNKYFDKYAWIPLGGHVAGLCANTDLVAEPWFSPAGYNRGQLLGITKLAYNPKQADRDDLYKARVNSVVSQPGQGILLFGDKTALSKPSAFDRINVRRLFITLEKAISTAAKYMLFEINDEFTQVSFRNMTEPFLRDVKGRRGVTDFAVVCDGTNNTPQVVDANEFVGDIYIKPSRSINYLRLNFIATRSGVDFTEIIGNAQG